MTSNALCCACDIDTNDYDKIDILSKIYICEFCEKKFCINCMYLFCFVCKEYYACFKCGWNYKTNKNIDSICYPKEHLKKYLRCKKHI